MTQPIPDPHKACYLDSEAELRQAASQWQGSPCLAVDTEFERSRTFYPRPALVQVSDGTQIWLVDPLALDDLTPLARVLEDPAITKIVHACGEDLETIDRLLGTTPWPLFDTQVAAALAGHGFSAGYARLVLAVFGTEIPKDQTRSDWLKRPLTASQLRYAALDVAYLLPLYHALHASIRAAGREAWLQEEMDRMVRAHRAPFDPHTAYLRVRGAARLEGRALAVLQALCAWREDEARRRDLPRNFIVKDPVLLEMARLQPATAAALDGIEGLHPGERRRNGRRLIDLIAEAAAQPASEWPGPLDGQVDLRPHSRTLSRLKRVVRETATRLEIPPELIAQSRVLERLLRTSIRDGRRELPPELEGWRREVVGDALLAALDAGG